MPAQDFIAGSRARMHAQHSRTHVSPQGSRPWAAGTPGPDRRGRHAFDQRLQAVRKRRHHGQLNAAVPRGRAGAIARLCPALVGVRSGTGGGPRRVCLRRSGRRVCGASPRTGAAGAAGATCRADRVGAARAAAPGRRVGRGRLDLWERVSGGRSPQRARVGPASVAAAGLKRRSIAAGRSRCGRGRGRWRSSWRRGLL